jgi:hypothetical protein
VAVDGPETQQMLERALAGRLSDSGARWLTDARQRVADDAAALAGLFPAAARNCGREPLAGPPGGPRPPAEPGLPGGEPVTGWTADEAVRALLLLEVPSRHSDLGTICAEVYRYGDAAEKRAVLRALAVLDVGEHGLPLVRDALRGNDTRLIAAALGPYAAQRLDDAGYRQAVLKCVFLGIPLSAVSGLAQRADPDLASMLADFARERVAAGRDVPADVWPLLARFPAAVQAAGLPEELNSPAEQRRAAASRALSALASAGDQHVQEA